MPIISNYGGKCCFIAPNLTHAGENKTTTQSKTQRNSLEEDFQFSQLEAAQVSLTSETIKCNDEKKRKAVSRHANVN